MVEPLRARSGSVIPLPNRFLKKCSFSAGQYRSTEKGYELFEKIIYGHLAPSTYIMFTIDRKLRA